MSSVLETADPEADFISATDRLCDHGLIPLLCQAPFLYSEVNLLDAISGFQTCCHQSHLEGF